MAGSVRDIDRGFQALMKRLLGADGELTVGIHATEGGEAAADSDGALTVVQVAAFHEFGLGHNPRRSFVADWADEFREKHQADLRKMGRAILDGKVQDADQALERLGNLYVAEIQKRIATNIPPPLKQATIKRKGSSVALINTGQMRSAITYVVKKSGSGGT